MWRGLYTAAAGMIQETQRTDVISNNLANVNTNGFKRDVAVSEEFEPMLIRRINDKDMRNDVTSFKGFSIGGQPPIVGTLGLGSEIAEVATDRSQGTFETTGNPYDVAIAGNGYLEVQTPQGVRYTRDGAMIRSATGQLQNMRGQAILGTNGQPIMIPANATDVVINENGQILARVPGQDAHQQLGQLALVDFADRRALLKQGDNLYYPQQGAQPQPATGTIEQGVLERSNSNVVEEMVQLINNYRIYEAGSKAVTTQDGMLDKSVNDVGRLG